MRCWQCDSELVEDAAYCAYCGERASMACSSCGGFNHPDGLYCRHCGQRLAGEEIPVIEEEPLEPAADTPERPDPVLADISSYESARVRANWTIAFLMAICVLNAVVVLIVFSLYDMVSRMVADKDVGFHERVLSFISEEFLISLENYGYQAEIGLTVLTVVPFLMWHFRASKNLQGFVSSGQSYTPGWALGCWFIPILNLFLPYRAISEVWRGSDRHILTEADFDWEKAPGTILLPLWWGLWIVSRFAGRFAGAFMESSGATLNDPNVTDLEVILDSLSTALWASSISGALTIAAAILAILVVHRITNRQDEIARLAMVATSHGSGRVPTRFTLRSS